MSIPAITGMALTHRGYAIKEIAQVMAFHDRVYLAEYDSRI